MKVKEFKKWLDQFDEDTIVEVLIQEKAPEYSPYGQCIHSEFVGAECEDYDYVDFAGNRFVKPESPHFGKKILVLGASD